MIKDNMNPIKWFLFAFVDHNFPKFERFRAPRPEFWWFFLIAPPCFLVLWFVLGLAAFLVIIAFQTFGWLNFSFISLANFAFRLAFLITWAVFVWPMCSVQVGRLRDCGKSGWYLLLNLTPKFGESAWWWLIPLLGPIILLIMYAQKGDEGHNRFGLPPAIQKPWLIKAYLKEASKRPFLDWT
jgi:uncharacterized membrane protein YhaH (DUF805 family)